MNDKYLDIMQKEDFKVLSKINFLGDLIEDKYKYKEKYLIEYLLERGIHSKEMDDYVVYRPYFARFYIKYNIIEPLLLCHLSTLLEQYDENNLIIDVILDRIDDNKKRELLHNIKVGDYTEFHDKEDEVIEIFKRHKIDLKTLFVTTEKPKFSEIKLSMEDEQLINEFYNSFKGQDKKVLDLMANEFKKCLVINHNRTIYDIKKLIEFKKEHPKFILTNSESDEGEYNSKNEELSISLVVPLVFSHELSHFLFTNYDKTFVYQPYEELRKRIITKENREKMTNYLELFHMEYDDMLDYYEKEYYEMVNTKYGSFDNYIEIVCQDVLNNKPNFITIWNKVDRVTSMEGVDESNISDIVLELLIIEKNEYVISKTRNHLAAKLMLENLFDALLMGELFDGDNCKSGHGALYFKGSEQLSFDECLADYDAILKSSEKDDVLDDMQQILGNELIDFLNNYLKENREEKHEHR